MAGLCVMSVWVRLLISNEVKQGGSGWQVEIEMLIMKDILSWIDNQVVNHVPPFASIITYIQSYTIMNDGYIA